MGLLDIINSQKIPTTVQRRALTLEAQGVEKIIEVHRLMAAKFVYSLKHFLSAEEAVDRYLSAMIAEEEIAIPVRNRVFSTLSEGAYSPTLKQTTFSLNPKHFVQGIKEQRRKNREADLRSLYLLSISLDAVVNVHVENATQFVTLLEPYVSSLRAIEMYLESKGLSEDVQQLVYHKCIVETGKSYIETAEKEDVEKELIALRNAEGQYEEEIEPEKQTLRTTLAKRVSLKELRAKTPIASL